MTNRATNFVLWALNLAVLTTFGWLYVNHFHPEMVSAWDQAYIHFMDDTFGQFWSEEVQ
jgi:hypothetical protein